MGTVSVKPPSERLPGPAPANRVCAEARQLPLHARDGSLRAVAVVDASDFDDIGHLPWCLSAQGYPARRKDDRLVLLHRELFDLDVGAKVEVDHINRNRLDNRRSNLRVVPVGSQPQNMSGHEGTSSRFRGVSKRGNRWVAQVGMRNEAGVEENFYLGLYQQEEEAAAVSARWRHEHFPLSNEDPALLSLKSYRMSPKRITSVECENLRMLELSTTLSRRQMEEMTGVTSSTIRRVLGRPAPHARGPRRCLHHEMDAHGGHAA